MLMEKSITLAGPDIVKVEALCETVANELHVKLPPFRIPRWMVLAPACAVEKLYSLWNGDPPVDHRKVDFFSDRTGLFHCPGQG